MNAAGRQYYVDHTTKTTSWTHPGEEEEVPLPAGWECRRTSQGREYYVDHTTKTTSWTPPSEKGVPLPAGWTCRRTPQGREYYVDHTTQTNTWRHPVTNVVSRESESDPEPLSLGQFIMETEPVHTNPESGAAATDVERAQLLSLGIDEEQLAALNELPLSEQLGMAAAFGLTRIPSSLLAPSVEPPRRSGGRWKMHACSPP